MVSREFAQLLVGNSTKRHLGVVLAGGKSSRMGTDKALLPFRAGSLLDFQFDKLKSVVGDENVVVSGYYPKLKHVVDEQAHLGPLGGIMSVIKKYPEIDCFLFIPVDMPNLETASLRFLLKSVEEQSEFDCWSYKNSEMPLVIKNHKSLILVFEKLLRLPKSMRSVRSLCLALKHCVVEVPCDNQNEFLNANTSAEWNEVPK